MQKTPDSRVSKGETLTAAACERRSFVKATAGLSAALGLFSVAGGTALAAKLSSVPPGAANFYKSTKVDIRKVTFKSQYQINIVANLVTPKGLDRKSRAPAIVIGHPMGAVKEQSSMLYAQKLAEQGFVTLAIDQAYWGESGGEPRNLVAPDTYVESFSAAVDFLGTQSFIDRNRIGVLGICGSGGFAIAAAKLDPRLRAIATASMYDMGAVTRNGLNKSLSLDQRKALLAKSAEQRDTEYTTGKGIFLNYLPKQPDASTDPVTREFWDYYRTPRGIAIPAGRTLELTQSRMLTSEVRFMNFYPFNDIDLISPRPLLFITGDQAHSKEFSEEAYRLSTGPKELLWVPGANHIDLYDRVDLIPWAKLSAFFAQSLAA